MADEVDPNIVVDDAEPDVLAVEVVLPYPAIFVKVKQKGIRLRDNENYSYSVSKKDKKNDEIYFFA